jgi:chitin disaccharide deacetylase
LKKLIVNADDFGLHTEVNRAIIKGHVEGCLTSTSLVAAGAAVEEAAQLACENPTLGIGAHLTLVAERPVLSPEKIPSLVTAEGRLLPDHASFIKHFVKGEIRLTELYNECDAQITRLEQLGVKLTHMDSHQHLHVLPWIIDICLELAKRHGLHKMRLPAEPYLFTGAYPAPLARKLSRGGLTFCAHLARHKAMASHMLMPSHFFGMLAGGHMEEKYFLEVLHLLPEGSSEIMIHPGMDNKTLGSVYDWQYHWEEELYSAISPRVMQYLVENHVQLISFKELADE